MSFQTPLVSVCGRHDLASQSRDDPAQPECIDGHGIAFCRHPHPRRLHRRIGGYIGVAMVNPICFMVMPFGKKATGVAAEGVPPMIDFDSLWFNALQPALAEL